MMSEVQHREVTGWTRDLLELCLAREEKMLEQVELVQACLFEVTTTRTSLSSARCLISVSHQINQIASPGIHPANLLGDPGTKQTLPSRDPSSMALG